MCLAVPFKIISIDKNEAYGEFDGIRRKIRIDFIEDVKIDDYVIVHGGIAIEKMDERMVLENIEAIREITNGL